MRDHNQHMNTHSGKISYFAICYCQSAVSGVHFTLFRVEQLVADRSIDVVERYCRREVNRLPVTAISKPTLWNRNNDPSVATRRIPSLPALVSCSISPSRRKKMPAHARPRASGVAGAAFTAPVVLRSSALFASAPQQTAPARCSSTRVAPRAAAFRLSERGGEGGAEGREVGVVASARAITPMRRPGNGSEAQQAYTEETPLPSGRRSDLMAPAKTGFWALVPYVAGVAVVGAAAFVAAKRFQVRQANLVEDFGEVMVYYGNSPESMREIVQDYKGKLGPGVLRGAMYRSYLRNLVTEKPVGPSTIEDATAVKSLLRISDTKAVLVFNALGAVLQDSPSLLGKLLFLANRVLGPDVLSQLDMMPLFPYGEETVTELQRNMVERCFRDLVVRALDENTDAPVPMEAATALRLEVGEANKLFDSVVLERIKAKEDEASALAAAESEDAAKPQVSDLDYPARSGEPAKAAVHAYQCSQCGYTMFPAAGREFKCKSPHH